MPFEGDVYTRLIDTGLCNKERLSLRFSIICKETYHVKRGLIE